ncbi:MAG: hypothetical protein ACLQNG_16320 [Acidimicrobiales bacterium]|jgi:hypothetical protein
MDVAIDESGLRRLTAMWANAARLQISRVEEAMEPFRLGVSETQFRETFKERGEPSEWAEIAAEYTRILTQGDVWQVGTEKYFLLLALAQLRKCVVYWLPHDRLPGLRDDRVLMLIRNAEEHWDDPDGRSLLELRRADPDIAPGMIRYNNHHLWIGDVSLDELQSWVDDVDRAVREHATASGSPVPLPGDEYRVSSEGRSADSASG